MNFTYRDDFNTRIFLGVLGFVSQTALATDNPINYSVHNVGSHVTLVVSLFLILILLVYDTRMQT
jgi:purine-cytosine permease-like protein